MDRTAASAALHIHRNTLAYRLRRIEAITGLDLASPRDLARAHIACEQGLGAAHALRAAGGACAQGPP